MTLRLLLVGKCLGKTRRCSVLLFICFRRFMETRNVPKEFVVCSPFCVGEPGGSRKFLGALLVYSSFGPAFSGQTKDFFISLLVSSWFPFDPLHFNQSQNLEIDEGKLHYNYCAFAELSQFVCCLLAPVFQMFRRNLRCQGVSSRYSAYLVSIPYCFRNQKLGSSRSRIRRCSVEHTRVY